MLIGYLFQKNGPLLVCRWHFIETRVRYTLYTRIVWSFTFSDLVNRSCVSCVQVVQGMCMEYECSVWDCAWSVLGASMGVHERCVVVCELMLDCKSRIASSALLPRYFGKSGQLCIYQFILTHFQTKDINCIKRFHDIFCSVHRVKTELSHLHAYTQRTAPQKDKHFYMQLYFAHFPLYLSNNRMNHRKQEYVKMKRSIIKRSSIQ